MLPSEPGSAANSTDTYCPTQLSREDPAAISPSAFAVVVVYALTLVSFRLSYKRATLECVAKPSFQVVEAYERAAKMEERLVDVVPPLVAHRKPTVARKPRQRTLHHPPVPSELLARVDPPAGDAGGYAPLPERLPAAREVVCLVGVQLRGTLARPAGAPTRL